MLTIYGHRGLPSKAPENTIASFKAASEIEGVKWLELDVAITKDKQLIIIHDDYLNRTTSMSGEITALNYEELKEASAGSWYGAKFKDERLPTFDDVIEIANEYNMNLNVELKGVTGANGLVLSKSMVKQVKEKLANLNQNQEVLMPEYKRAVIFHTTSFKEDWRTLLDYCNAKIVNTEDAKLTKAKVRMVKEAGYELNVWTVNKPARANQLANWGVDGIFTDSADKMVHLSE